ncbi:MAG: ADOP family duplicated permease [Gemmatimonas sp.]
MTGRAGLQRWLRHAREFVFRQRVNNEMDEEIQFHLDQEASFNVQRGMSPAEAHRAAMQAFGGVQRYREETRDARGFVSLDSLIRDTRLGFRRLRRAPAYSLGVIVTLAVGLGIATGIGALVYGVMLRPLPYTDADRLVRISIHTPGLAVTTSENSAGTFVYFSERAHTVALLGASMENEGIAITDGTIPERVTGALLTPNVFQILQTKPAAGRLLREDDLNARFDGPVMISYALWQRRYGGAPDIAGKRIELNRNLRTIAGVLPAGFAYPSRSVAIYYPDRVEASKAGLSNRYLTVVGRLAPGVSIAQAQAELNGLVANIRDRFPELPADIHVTSGLSAHVETLRDGMIAQVRPELQLLALMIGALLLIAVANVATLSLLRAQRLRTEVAISRVLGANRRTLTQRFVVEGIVVSLAGGALALPIAVFSVASKFGLSDAQVPRLNEVTITPGIAITLLGVSIAIGTTFGVLSAARAGSVNGNPASLRLDTRTARGRGWRRAQEGIVTVQIALALSLLLSAGLMASSFARLRQVDIGFDSANGAKFTTQLPFLGYSTFQRTAAFDLSVIDALRAVPGVTSVGAAMQMPSTPQDLYSRPRVEGTDSQGQTRQTLITANVVTQDFFKVMGIPVKAGRAFERGDLIAITPGVVLGATLARELFGADNPIGREVRIESSRRYPTYRVVGVVGDVYSDRLTEGVLRVLYFPLLGDLPPGSTETESRIPFMPGGMNFIVNSSRALSELTPEFRRAVASIDSRVPVWSIRSLDAIAADASARARLSMLLLGVVAFATLLLGSIGLYSVIAYAAAGRSREFAVRLAIGATPRAIARQVFREGVRVTAIGIVGGFLLSYASAGVLRDLVFEISATEPLMYLGTAGVVLACTMIATFSPARRAGNTDPARALHGE